jgi:hypothetical protein
MQPSDSLASFGRGFGSPRRRPTSWGRRLFCRLCRRPVRAPANAPASEMRHRLSVDRNLPRRDEDLPGYWAVLFVRAVVQHPAGYDPSSPLLLFEKTHGKAVVAFREDRTLGIRNDKAFEAATPRLTRSRAYASPASLPRPSQGSLPARAGSPLAGRVSHPLDSESKFHEAIAALHSPSTSRAWSHYPPFPRSKSAPWTARPMTQ